MTDLPTRVPIVAERQAEQKENNRRCNTPRNHAGFSCLPVARCYRIAAKWEPLGGLTDRMQPILEQLRDFGGRLIALSGILGVKLGNNGYEPIGNGRVHLLDGFRSVLADPAKDGHAR